MANAKATRTTGESAVGDERNLPAHADTVERGGRRQHLAHSRPALWAFVADDEDFTLLDPALNDGFKTVLLAVEYARWPGELQAFHAGDFDDAPFRRQVALEADDPAGR